MADLVIDDKWGVDIQILLQIVKKGAKIAEVDIGRLRHKKQPIESLAVMSEDVMKSILSEMGLIANRHRLIVFDFDKTLIEESSVEILAQEFGFEKELADVRSRHKAGELKDMDITLAIARFLKGKTKDEIESACEKIHLTKNICKVAERLRRRRYEMAIVSVAYSPVIEHFARKLGIKKENIICPILLTDRGSRYTGEVVARTKHNSQCCDRLICKAEAVAAIMAELHVKAEQCIAVGDGRSDECMFRACGLALAYRPEIPIGDVTITDMTEILIHAE
jgi:phosphoserine phosphatase